MRRGHPGIGTWRSDNSRHFRPRSSGGSHFRSSNPFGSVDAPRFPPPVQRYRGPRPYNAQPVHSDDSGPLDNDRQYRGPPLLNSQSRSQDRGHHDNRDRQILPLMQLRVQESNRSGSYNNSTSYFEGNKYNTNNMGDVDHRQQDIDLRQQNFLHKLPSWSNPPYERRQFHNDKTPKQHSMGDALLPQPDYTGHRPPASDHYSGTSGPNNNNNPYSRSVDDTVDIVRKRLMNRDSQDHPDQTNDQREMDRDLRKNVDESYHDPPQEQPVKKRVQRQIKSNCNKMKNKIVHQLFKMDKGKIHKLMDNPNSSSKFEYAISSLITESQNSFNRHLRSVAEKSLTTTSTSSDFIHDDNNTIYEDTFMRQMQGVLDPQDTVLLEDIKPLVLAELSKVLCLDDFDRGECIDDHGRYSRDEYNAYYNEPGSEYPHNSFYDHEHESNHGNEEMAGGLYEDRKYDFSQQSSPPQLYERRPAKQPNFQDDRSRSRSNERWQPRRSIDDNSLQNKSNEDKVKDTEESRPLFDGNCDQLSEDDDPFADLDNQYHVAVDHNFIEQEDGVIGSPMSVNHSASQSPPTVDKKDVKLCLSVPVSSSNNITKDIDNQLQSIAKSPLKLFPANKYAESNTVKVKVEIQENVAAIKETLLTATENEKVKTEPIPAKELDGEPVKHAHDSGKHHSRKRSADSKPSHRKEKRKKSSHSESHEAATSIFNMFNDGESATRESKSVYSTDKGYSDKYVKRKEPPKKSKEKEPDPPKTDTQTKQNSNTSHSITSPKDTSGSSIGDQTPSKIDKVKLTAIDIFSESTKTKKVNPHQAHRNTSTPLAAAKNQDENKIKPIIPTIQSFARKLSKRHMGTQVIRKIRNRECQTIKVTTSNTGTQTEPVKFEKKQRISSDPLERMKEIDMEIQMLLQEKFKLYNSMESNSKSKMSSGSTMDNLGMAVLNVPSKNDKDENEDSLADSIAEDFTNLPVEELEQIAMETIAVRDVASPAVEKKGRARKISDMSRKNSESPTARKKKVKTPNISLLEQIITDDRPIEEIISLDDLEETPTKSKRKPHSRPSKRKPSKKHNSKPFVVDLKLYNLKKCSVVLHRFDMDEYLKSRADSLKIKINLKSIVIQDDDKKTESKGGNSIESEQLTENSQYLNPIPESEFNHPENPTPEPRVEETANDIQIDMMEVCEDIVIGDEVKATTDANEREVISEEIILDNSQSSAEYTATENGGRECKMYDYSTDDSLKRDAITITGNADAVLAIECIDNSFIAACLDGNVYHFSTDGQLLNTLRGSNLAVTCLTIVKEKYGTTVYTGSLDSRIRYYDLETGLEKGPECNVLSPIQTMDRAWDTVFVGTRTGFVLQFECKNNMLIPVSTVKFSEQSILALRAMKEGPRKVLLVAARSDNVTIKDAQTGLLLRTLDGPKMTVYSLLFEDGKVYCGTSNHQIHVFDYTSGTHVHAHEGGKGAVCLRATGGLVFAGCYDGCVYVYREGETRPLAQLRGPALMLLSLAIQGTKIIAGYKDRSLYIWKIPLAVLQEMIL